MTEPLTTPPSTGSTPKVALTVLLVVVGLILAGQWLRGQLGIEWSASGVRELVGRYPAWAPALFILLLVIRPLIVMPSALLLTAGGLLFGVLWGALYGGIGLTLAGLAKYGLVHWAGAETMRARVPSRYGGALNLARSKAGAAAVALVSGYPLGPIGLVHVGAAIAGMALPVFAAAALSGSVVRAGTYAVFGNSLVEGEGMLLGLVILAVACVLPFLHPRSRAWLRQVFERTPASNPPAPGTPTKLEP